MASAASPAPKRLPVRLIKKDSTRTRVEVLENKLWLGNLDSTVSEYNVLQLCRPFGNIVNNEFLWHISGPKRGQPRGYCFVEFSKHEDAVAAKKGLNGKIVASRPLSVDFVQDRPALQPEPEPGRTLGRAPFKKGPTTTVSAEEKIRQLKLKLQMMAEEDQKAAPPSTSATPQTKDKSSRYAPY